MSEDDCVYPDEYPHIIRDTTKFTDFTLYFMNECELRHFLDPSLKNHKNIRIEVSGGDTGYGEILIGVDPTEYAWVNNRLYDKNIEAWELRVEWDKMWPLTNGGRITCDIISNNTSKYISTYGELRELYDIYVYDRYKELWKNPKLLTTLLHEKLMGIHEKIQTIQHVCK